MGDEPPMAAGSPSLALRVGMAGGGHRRGATVIDDLPVDKGWIAGQIGSRCRYGRFFRNTTRSVVSTMGLDN